MSKIKIAALSLMLLLGGVYYLNKGGASTYDKPGAKEQMAALVKDIAAWRSATGTYIGAPKGSGAMLAAGDTFRAAAREQLVHPLQFHGGPRAEAAGGAMAQLQMRNRRCHSSAGVHQQRLQPQVLHHHPSDQRRAHTSRQRRQGMGAPLRWA